MKRKATQPKVQTMETVNAESIFDETPVMEQPQAIAEPKHHVNEPENGCYGEIKMFCGRATKPCHFREFIDASPSGLYAACTRCKDLRLKIDTNSKI